jgi:NAD+ kinase
MTKPDTQDHRETPPTSLGLVAALSKREAQELAGELISFLTGHDVEVVPENALSPDARHQVDGIIVLGGDGLMMRAAKAYADVPLLGINFGKVGFLAHVERDDWRTALTSLLDG